MTSKNHSKLLKERIKNRRQVLAYKYIGFLLAKTFFIICTTVMSTVMSRVQPVIRNPFRHTVYS